MASKSNSGAYGSLPYRDDLEPILPTWEGGTSVPPPAPQADIYARFVPAEPSWFGLAVVLAIGLLRYLRLKNT